MDYTSNPLGPPDNEHPNKHDYDELVTIYSHLDSSTTVSSTSAASRMPPAASRGDFNSQSEWGRKVKESPNGKLEVWERDFGRGQKLITFVKRP
jgi:hypothetical protein